VRWPYARAIPFAILLLTLPFNWTETTSCQSAPHTELRTGFAILFSDGGSIAILVTLFALMFLTLWLATRVTSFLRAVAHLLSTLTCALLLALVHFWATFSMGDKIRVFWAGYVAFSALVLSLIEAFSRTILATLEAWWARQNRRRG